MNLTICISGSGTNLQAILDAIDANELNAKVIKVIADRECQGINRAITASIPFKIIHRKKIQEHFVNAIPNNTDYIVLAGFLSIIPSNVIEKFREQIINIHPSLLPKFGGKGMYGIRVHQAVIDANETESGCTVHFVDEGIDTGKTLAQRKVPVFPDDTAQNLQQRVLKEEHQVLVEVLKNLSKV